MKAHKDVPQGLKPSARVLRDGTAEPVPFVEGIFPSEHVARRAGVESADLSTPPSSVKKHFHERSAEPQIPRFIALVGLEAHDKPGPTAWLDRDVA
jgi:hypothetical protein